MVEYLCDLILLFFTFSVLGWCTEVVLKYRQFHRFINRGFLIGPYLPIYGTGIALVTVLVDALSRYEDSLALTFLVSFVACGTLEYLVSWVMELRFHLRWWDYSQKPMNLNGRVWIGNLILFGIAGTVVAAVIDPWFFSLTAQLSLPLKEYLSIGIAVLMLTDYAVSHFVMKLLKSGIESSEADDTEAIGKELRALFADKSALQRRFVEAYPEVVYRTDLVKQRLKRIREESELIGREVSERLRAEKDALVYSHEPTFRINAELVGLQRELIDQLRSEKPDAARIAELDARIEKRTAQLEQRVPLTERATSAVKQLRDSLSE